MCITSNSILQLKTNYHTGIYTWLQREFNKMYWKCISQHNGIFPVVGKRVPKTSFDLFFLNFKLLILVTVTNTNVEEKLAEVEQQPLLIDNKDKTHYKGMRLIYVKRILLKTYMTEWIIHKWE